VIKKEIAAYLYERHGGMTLDEAERNTNILFDMLGEAIVAEESVTITGFGRFKHKQRSVREVHLPNGERKLSAGGERIQFLPSPKLKTLINS
jgi:nucleoid DNA-binding protein